METVSTNEHPLLLQDVLDDLIQKTDELHLSLAETLVAMEHKMEELEDEVQSLRALLAESTCPTKQ